MDRIYRIEFILLILFILLNKILRDFASSREESQLSVPLPFFSSGEVQVLTMKSTASFGESVR